MIVNEKLQSKWYTMPTAIVVMFGILESDH